MVKKQKERILFMTGKKKICSENKEKIIPRAIKFLIALQINKI